MLKLADADSVENRTGTTHPIITPVACALPHVKAVDPKMSGTDPVRILPGTRLHAIVGKTMLAGEYWCNYAVNEAYEPRFTAAGLKVSARGMGGETRAVELEGHPFFVATLFQPQLTSAAHEPHPVIVAFLKACLEDSGARGARIHASKA